MYDYLYEFYMQKKMNILRNSDPPEDILRVSAIYSNISE